MKIMHSAADATAASLSFWVSQPAVGSGAKVQRGSSRRTQDVQLLGGGSRHWLANIVR